MGGRNAAATEGRVEQMTQVAEPGSGRAQPEGVTLSV
jgi:hypothetical protein